MSYSDVIKAVDMHGGALNKTMSSFGNKGNNINSYASQGTNPWSSGAYTTSNYRGFANGQPDIYDDRVMYNDMNSGMTNFDKTLVRGAAGMQGYKMGNMASPYIGDAFGATAASNFNLGPAMAVRGVFGTDNNPYTYTRGEAMGNTTSNMMLAHQASKLLPATSALSGGTALSLGSTAAIPAVAAVPAVAATATSAAIPAVAGSAAVPAAMGVNPYVMLAVAAFSYLRNKSKKKKVKKLNQKVAREIGEEDTRLYTERSDKLQENRDDMLAQAGSYQHGQEASRYDNQYGGNYSNRYQYNEGGKLSPKEMKKVQNLGRRGDTMLAHINPQEAEMLKAMGGSGTINPYTGLREYGNLFNSFLSGIGNVVSTVGGGILDGISGGNDALGDPIGAIGDGVSAVGGALTDNVIDPVLGGALDAAGNLIDGTLDGVKALGHDVLIPLAKPILGAGIDVLQGIAGMFDGGDDGQVQVNPGEAMDPTKREANVRTKEGAVPTSGIKFNANVKLKGDKDKQAYKSGNWVSDKENPYIAPNVEEEIDYAAQGMKYKYADGGKMNVVAEFTGNELIVNEQAQVEEALANGNYAAAAAPIRRAMGDKQVTPGPETHNNNPMPVDSDGNIYAAGGKLPFRVNKGAGIYDHATDQFNSKMSDKEISMVAQKNINKWQSNNMNN